MRIRVLTVVVGLFVSLMVLSCAKKIERNNPLDPEVAGPTPTP